MGNEKLQKAQDLVEIDFFKTMKLGLTSSQAKITKNLEF
jgi:hypothetical protein